MKKIILIFLILFLPGIAWAETNSSSEIILSALDTVKLAGHLVDFGKYDDAEQILTKLPTLQNGSLETERWFLLAQISARRGDLDTAIKIYRKILDDRPDLARVRFELAVCYMKKKLWSRADYHLRLAMAGKDLPVAAMQMMNYYRYIIRQNKNWNMWFNFGAAPDNNINTSAVGEECVDTMFGPMCRQLPEPVSAIGANMALGGNYEFKMSDNWRWKSDATIYSNVYDKHEFDDLYLSLGTGPRYVWPDGDVWLAATAARRWYGWDAYYWATGAKVDINYDFTRRVAGGMSLRFISNMYDEFGDFLDGQTYSANLHLSYSINASMYAVLRGGIDREVAADPIYTNWRPNVAVGFGAELPFGVHAYIEPSFYWTHYDDARWVVHDGAFDQVREHSFNQRYALSLSNNKLNVWGFVPTITVSFTRRVSNIWQREYDKTAIEFTMQQRF